MSRRPNNPGRARARGKEATPCCDSTDVTSKGGKASPRQGASQKRAPAVRRAHTRPRGGLGTLHSDFCVTAARTCKYAEAHPQTLTHAEDPSTAPATQRKCRETASSGSCWNSAACAVLSAALRGLLNSQDPRVLTSPAHLAPGTARVDTPFISLPQGTLRGQRGGALDCQL